MDKVNVYEKPTCTTCRKVVKALKEKGIEFDRINYYINPFSEDKLRELIRKMKIEPVELLRKREKHIKN